MYIWKVVVKVVLPYWINLIVLFNELNLYVKGAAIQASPSSGIPESGPPI